MLLLSGSAQAAAENHSHQRNLPRSLIKAQEAAISPDNLALMTGMRLVAR